MSINIGLVSNKPEFTNFFSENVTLPVNSECVLAKANMDIPVITLTSVKVPAVPAADRADNVLSVMVDGISNVLTWTEIYMAHTAMAEEDIDAGVSADEYFSGDYEYFPNNSITGVDPADGHLHSKLNFPNVLAKALTDKFEFYNFEVQLDKPQRDLGNRGEIDTYTFRNFTDPVAIMTFNKTKAWKLIATYTPQRMAEVTRNNATIAGAANSGFVLSGGNDTLTSSAALNQAWGSNENIIDVNGGYWQTTVTHAGAGISVYGISLEGVGHGNDEYNPVITAFEPEVFDVGFQFEVDAGVKVYKIIDGNKQHVYYDTNANAEVTVTKPLYHPPNAKLKFNDGDDFFIQVQRGNLYNGTNEFVIRLYQGHNTHDFSSANTELVYVAKRTLKSSAITPNIGFMSDGTAGQIFANNELIIRTTDTLQQCQWRLLLGEAFPFPQEIGTMNIRPLIRDHNTYGLLTREFFSAYGLYSDDDSEGMVLGANSNIYQSIESINQTLTLTATMNLTTVNSQSTIFLGTVPIEEAYKQDARPNGATNTTIINRTSPLALQNLPKELKVAINNLPIKSFQGQYINTALPRPIAGGESRVIGTIPIPEIADGDVSIPIVYEPFNLLYRPLNNVQPFNFNQVFCEIYFQDFNTNERRTFSSVNGHLTLDINVRQGAREPKVQNNLRPV